MISPLKSYNRRPGRHWILDVPESRCEDTSALIACANFVLSTASRIIFDEFLAREIRIFTAAS
jgi:hypothetical protein